MMTGKVCVGGLGQGRECRVRAACVWGGLVDLCLTQLCLCVFVPCARVCVCVPGESRGGSEREKQTVSPTPFFGSAIFEPRTFPPDTRYTTMGKTTPR